MAMGFVKHLAGEQATVYSGAPYLPTKSIPLPPWPWPEVASVSAIERYTSTRRASIVVRDTGIEVGYRGKSDLVSDQRRRSLNW
jgi:hypothetical protein